MSDGQEYDWMTDMDEEILQILASELILSPSIISENIDRSRAGVSRRLNALEAGGLVEKLDRGKYKITYDGFELVSEPVEVSDFDPTEENSIDE